VRSSITARLQQRFPDLQTHCVGFYWPFKAEVDLRGFVRALIAKGAKACLPVVVERRQPVEFWAWEPRTKLARGVWNIPIPAERHVVTPSALLIPLVGFDPDCYRLGFGGGYYDRTLARMDPKPLRIGIGLELGRLNSIWPQPHDIPLDAVVTESRVWERTATSEGS
jgi:5-formyltetrahydrofolate cyclo-ligase